MRVLLAAGLVMHALHQPAPVVKAMSLHELWVWARIAAALTGRSF